MNNSIPTLWFSVCVQEGGNATVSFWSFKSGSQQKLALKMTKVGSPRSFSVRFRFVLLTGTGHVLSVGTDEDRPPRILCYPPTGHGHGEEAA